MLTAEQVATKFSVSARTVRNWCESGTLKAHKFAGVWAIDSEALETFERPRLGRPTESPTISDEERQAIEDEAGLIDVRVVRVRQDSHGYPHLLLEGRDNSDAVWRGWLHEGESAYNIAWDCENVGGWPEELCD